MKKLKFNLNELKVDTFYVSNKSAESNGTVYGNRPTPYSGCGDMTCGNTGCGDCASAYCSNNCGSNDCNVTNYTCRTCFEDTCRTDVPHHCTGEKTYNYDCMM